MKRSSGPRRRRRLQPTSLDQRAALLAAFDQSDMSAAAFAREHGIGYSTFCGWRQRRSNGAPAPGFIQVELSSDPTPVEVVVEIGAHARVRIHSIQQLELVSALLHRLHAAKPC